MVLLVFVGVVSVGTHRRGIPWGDDFTLYLRQAKGLVDGNVGQVIADNHDNVLLAARANFSPFVYPWGWPMLLAPFVRLLGLNYARLKLVEVACWLTAVGGFHRIFRRRMHPVLAFGLTAAIGTSLPYLRYTGQLLSEMPYMALAAITLWWLDRCRGDGPLDMAGRRRLVILGLLAMAVFNTRREGLAMVPTLAIVQLVDGRGRWRAIDWRAAATPLAAFAAGVVGLQLMLPSTLAPELTGSGLGQTWAKLRGPFRTAFRDQLGFGSRSALAWAVFGLVAVGVAVRLRRAWADDIALVVFSLVSMLIVGMVPALSDRYLMAVTIFAVYFAAQAVAAIGEFVSGLAARRLSSGFGVTRRRRSAQAPGARATPVWFAGAVLAAAVGSHLVQIPAELRHASRDNARGVRDGPAAPYALAGFAAVLGHTRRDDIVAFSKARAMTLFTDRRAVQSSEFQIILDRADYFLMRRGSTSSQPLVSDQQASDAGLVSVWSDTTWVLWRVPHAGRP